MSKRNELKVLTESLLNSRLSAFKMIYIHFIWSSKMTSVHCEFYGVRDKDNCNYHLGQGWGMVGHIESKPGRHLPTLKNVAKLRAWMRTLEYIPKRTDVYNKTYLGLGTPVSH